MLTAKAERANRQALPGPQAPLRARPPECPAAAELFPAPLRPNLKRMAVLPSRQAGLPEKA
jgi:hypothetical protein